MPVDFLTEDQQLRYGRYSGDPSPAQLGRYFHLDDTDIGHVNRRVTDHNRLGFGVQLGTVRYLGTFLTDPTDVPAIVVAFVAAQLGIAEPECLARYLDRSTTRREHVGEIKRLYGYRDFTDQPEHFRMVRWLYTRAWLSAERPSVLFDLATARLVEQKVLLPGVSVLARLVAQVRDRAASRLWQTLSQTPDTEQRTRLESLLEVPRPASANGATGTIGTFVGSSGGVGPGSGPGGRADASTRQTPFDRLRRAPTHLSANGLVGALQRLVEVRALGVGDLDLSAVPPARLKALARYAMAARAQAISRMPQERRVATLLAFARFLEVAAQDDALDLLDLLIQELLARVTRLGDRERMRTIRDLDAAALRLREACQVILDPSWNDPEVRTAIFERAPRTILATAVTVVGDLARSPDDNYYEDLLGRYSTIRRFLPLLAQTIHFEAVGVGQPVLEAWRFLKTIEGQKGQGRPAMRQAPRGVINRSWRRVVFSQPMLTRQHRQQQQQQHSVDEDHQDHQVRHHGHRQIDRRYYTFCVLERLQDGLRSRDIFTSPSERWSDPRAKLLQGPAWESLRPKICLGLDHSPTPEAEVDALAHQLDEAYRRTAENLPANSAVRIERIDGHDTPILTRLDKLDEPPSLQLLREQVAALLPRVDLPEAILEVQEWTGFASEFTHVSEGNARVEDLPLSICAVLLAEACNIGLEPLVRQEIPALTRARLSWVQQNYIPAETLTQANARLVDYHSHLPLAQAWGGGEVASADGLRFVVPVRTINAAPNSKYFGVGRGVTYYNFTSDQFTGFHGIVIPGTLRDSLYILDGLLEQQTSLRPTEVMADSAAYSDVIFGLFWLLGYQFSPRLADIGEARFWRMDRSANYGVLDGVARHRINTKMIMRNWDDLLRVAGSLKMGTVRASDLIRSLHFGSRPSTLARAIGEAGRVPKTLHLLTFLDDETYRRRILTQLNRGEGRHSLARHLFYGQRGELRQPYREGQEDQLGALGLVINILVLWNTRYMQMALDELQSQGVQVKAEDMARLSPLKHKHIHMLGRYQFTLADSLRRGALRPLRDPTDPNEQML